MIVLDSGGLSRLAERTTAAAALGLSLREAGLWPPIVPTPVVVEALQGHPGRDARSNRLLRSCLISPTLRLPVARRAAELRRLASTGSAIDAIVVAVAEPGGVVVTGDRHDLTALAAHATGVEIVAV